MISNNSSIDTINIIHYIAHNNLISSIMITVIGLKTIEIVTEFVEWILLPLLLKIQMKNGVIDNSIAPKDVKPKYRDFLVTLLKLIIIVYFTFLIGRLLRRSTRM